MESLAHWGKVIIKKILKNGNIMKYRLIDSPLRPSAHLASAAVAVLTGHQQMRQIAVPQIAVKTIGSRLVQQAVYTPIKLSCHKLLCAAPGRIPPHYSSFFIFRYQTRHFVKPVIPPFRKLPVYNQFKISHHPVHTLLSQAAFYSMIQTKQQLSARRTVSPKLPARTESGKQL